MATVAIVGLLLLAPVREAAGQPASAVAPERVVIPSGTLRLTGLLWTPAGSGPFPAVLFNHGSNRTESEKAQALGQRLASVDTGRLVVGGHSFGGQLTLLAVERDKDVRAAVAFAPAAQSWADSPEPQKRLVTAARNIRTPIFLTHAANDFRPRPGTCCQRN